MRSLGGRHIRIIAAVFHFWVAGVLPPPAAFADTIVLKNGERIEGVESWKEDGMIKCLRFGAMVGYPSRLVERVDEGPVRVPDGAPGPAAEEAVPGPGNYRAIRIFDGDSFLATDGVMEFSVRIAGIDAPEGGRPAHGIKGQPFADEARDFLSRKILDRMVRIQGYGTDAYHRQLAEVFIGGRNVGLDLVRNGLAEAYRGKPADGVNIRLYREEENAARRSGLGVWCQDRRYVSPRDYRKTSRQQP